jgi:hypothetical protein
VVIAVIQAGQTGTTVRLPVEACAVDLFEIRIILSLDSLAFPVSWTIMSSSSCCNSSSGGGSSSSSSVREVVVIVVKGKAIPVTGREGP